MYDIYSTEGIVLKKFGVGESNTLVTVLTKKYGLVQMIARSTRAEKSKLRYKIEPFTKGRFSFVKGKAQWRLTGVDNALGGFVYATPHHFLASGRVAALLMRLIQGQEEVSYVYGAIEEGLSSIFLASREDLGIIECILVLRVLYRLGYVALITELSPFIEGNLFSEKLTSEAFRLKPLLIRTINESLKITGL